ncbi:hypothetical protein MNBD_GAMMA17-529 [hydrothermal vent metagenome]|uniref:Uncharacterized protein n=1 Tax=hydrothermal vent metagenome TaxID=652676 RepID=A0A3B0ZFE5_9ZZZZ
MKKLTSTSLIFAFALLFSAQSAVANSLDDKDMAFAFGSGSSIDMLMLSEQEMVETEGNMTFIPFLSGLGGFLMSVATQAWTGDMSTFLGNARGVLVMGITDDLNILLGGGGGMNGM